MITKNSKGSNGMKRYLFILLATVSILFLGGCNNGNDEFVDTRDKIIPIDTNIAYADIAEPFGDKDVLYYADPRPEENGLNRALRINYRHMTYEDLTCNGINPHSIDRAGTTNKFYMRTQNSYSFDVVNFANQTVITVDDGTELYHKPRAIGAYNRKYNIQLLSVKNRPAVDVIDVATNNILTVLGDNVTTIGSGSATGHALWFDEDHCGVVDRVNPQVWVYRVERNATNGQLQFTEIQKFNLQYPIHTLERVEHAKTEDDTYLFYATYEGDATLNPPRPPSIAEIRFDPFTGTLQKTRSVEFPNSVTIINGVKPITHHLGITPNGRYLIVPDFDGSVYVVDRKTFTVVKTLNAGLGAAHVNFSEKYNVAIVTSHFDQYVTVIDLKTFNVKADIYISTHSYDPNHPHLLQPHFSYVDPNGRYFYTFASQDGDFVKIDLKTNQVVDRLHTGGAPEQAHS